MIQWVAAGDGRGGPAFFLGYWLLAIAVGGPVVLAPSFALQAALVGFLQGRGAPRAGMAAAGGALQALTVWIWSLVVGIEPSLALRFRLTGPMIIAGFLAGALTAGLAPRPTIAPARPEPR